MALQSGEYRSGGRVVDSDGYEVIKVGNAAEAGATADNSMPTGYIAANMPRWGSASNVSALASGTLYMSAGMALPRGTTVTNITLCAGTTGATTPTAQWFCLTDMDRNVLMKTADHTTGAWASGATKTLALSSTYTPTVDIDVYVGCLVVATTVPSLRGAALSTGVNTLPPIYAGSSTTGLTTPGSLGATAAAITPASNVFWAAVS